MVECPIRAVACAEQRAARRERPSRPAPRLGSTGDCSTYWSSDLVQQNQSFGL